MLVRVLISAGSQRLTRRIADALAERSVVLERLAPDEDLLEHLERRGADIVILAQKLLPRPWPESLARLRALPERTEVVILVAREDPETRADLLAAGCLAAINQGLSPPLLADALRGLLRRRRDAGLDRLAFPTTQATASLDDFISHSQTMNAFVEVARRVTGSDTSLLILGETGVGKERLARAIHAEGPRASGPFLAVNCAALPEGLLESELFGHEEGAFTGAVRARRGVFELAHRGTLFLDEIAEAPLLVQAKLLRALQEREIQPVGAEAPVRVDVRVMAATNRDLAGEVAAGRFRADLYYRLCVVSLVLPPLRERREDIPSLIENYVAHFRAKLGRGPTRVSPDAMRALAAYSWPGNVRELINIVERAVLLGSGEILEPNDLPMAVFGQLAAAPARTAAEAVHTDTSAAPLFEIDWPTARAAALERFERSYFTNLLRATGGRIGVTARRAGITTRALHEKLRRLGVDKDDYRG